MTVVAAFRFDGCPIVFGDILISGPEPDAYQINIPTVGPVENVFPRGSGFVPVDLRQKVYLISPLCAVAWAGSQLKATMALKVLKGMERRGELEVQRIVDTLTSDPDLASGELHMVGWLAHPGSSRKVAFTHFGLGVRQAAGPDPGETTIAAGSGVDSFLTKLHNSTRFHAPLERSIAPATRLLDLFARLIHEEHAAVAQAESLRQYYGGGYEFAAWDGRKFVKPDNFTFFIWQATYADSEVELGLSLLWRQWYIDNLLCIRALKADLSHVQVVVRPLFGGSKRMVSSSETPFRADGFVCHIVHILTKPVNHYYVSIGARWGITFREENGAIDLEIDREYINDLIGQVRTYVQRLSLPGGQ